MKVITSREAIRVLRLADPLRYAKENEDSYGYDFGYAVGQKAAKKPTWHPLGFTNGSLSSADFQPQIGHLFLRSLTPYWRLGEEPEWLSFEPIGHHRDGSRSQLGGGSNYFFLRAGAHGFFEHPMAPVHGNSVSHHRLGESAKGLRFDAYRSRRVFRGMGMEDFWLRDQFAKALNREGGYFHAIFEPNASGAAKWPTLDNGDSDDCLRDVENLHATKFSTGPHGGTINAAVNSWRNIFQPLFRNIAIHQNEYRDERAGGVARTAADFVVPRIVRDGIAKMFAYSMDHGNAYPLAMLADMLQEGSFNSLPVVQDAHRELDLEGEAPDGFALAMRKAGAALYHALRSHHSPHVNHYVGGPSGMARNGVEVDPRGFAAEAAVDARHFPPVEEQPQRHARSQAPKGGYYEQIPGGIIIPYKGGQVLPREAVPEVAGSQTKPKRPFRMSAGDSQGGPEDGGLGSEPYHPIQYQSTIPGRLADGVFKKPSEAFVDMAANMEEGRQGFLRAVHKGGFNVFGTNHQRRHWAAGSSPLFADHWSSGDEDSDAAKFSRTNFANLMHLGTNAWGMVFAPIFDSILGIEDDHGRPGAAAGIRHLRNGIAKVIGYSMDHGDPLPVAALSELLQSGDLDNLPIHSNAGETLFDPHGDYLGDIRASMAKAGEMLHHFLSHHRASSHLIPKTVRPVDVEHMANKIGSYMNWADLQKLFAGRDHLAGQDGEDEGEPLEPNRLSRIRMSVSDTTNQDAGGSSEVSGGVMDTEKLSAP